MDIARQAAPHTRAFRLISGNRSAAPPASLVQDCRLSEITMPASNAVAAMAQTMMAPVGRSKNTDNVINSKKIIVLFGDLYL